MNLAVEDFKDVIGKTPAEAKKTLPPKFSIFVAQEDGQSFYRTMDFNPYRLNVWVKNGKIVKIDSLS